MTIRNTRTTVDIDSTYLHFEEEIKVNGDNKLLISAINNVTKIILFKIILIFATAHCINFHTNNNVSYLKKIEIIFTIDKNITIGFPFLFI